jgi:hypothetical protein
MKKIIAIYISIFAVSFFLWGSVQASESCNAKVLTNIGAMESLQSVLEKGEIIDSVTQYNKVVFKKSGYVDDNFCQHGGYCYPAHIRIKGRQIKSIQLLNCKIGKLVEVTKEDEYQREEMYSIE